MKFITDSFPFFFNLFTGVDSNDSGMSDDDAEMQAADWPTGSVQSVHSVKQASKPGSHVSGSKRGMS